MLGVLATLWATLIGKTIPELLDRKPPPLVAFRAEVNRACSSNVSHQDDEEIGYFADPLDGPDDIGPTTPVLPSYRSVDLASDFLGDFVNPIRDVMPDLLAINPPAGYEPTFRRFETNWRALGLELYEVYRQLSALDGSDPERYRLDLGQVLTKVSSVDALATRMVTDVNELDSDSCSKALIWVTDDLRRLDDYLMGREPWHHGF